MLRIVEPIDAPLTITEPDEAILRGQIGNGLTALDLLRDPDLTEAERATIVRCGIHGLTNAVETIHRLARSQESALGRRLAP